MKSGYIRNTGRAIVAASALALGVGASGVVFAQASEGAIVGVAKTGDTVLIRGSDTGFKRELKIEKDGKYQVRRVPTGYYDVSVTHADGSQEPIKNVVVKPGGAGRVQ